MTNNTAQQGEPSGTDNPDLPVRWEELPWESGLSMPMSRSQRAAIRPTYRAAIPASIASMSIAIDPDVTAEAEDARATITRFDAELSAMFPGTEFAPLSSVLLRTESASSSQIEDITTGAKALALAEIGLAKSGSNAALVAANVDAMNRALDLAENLTPDAIRAVHEALMRGQNHAQPGQFRDQPVWIGGSITPHKASFVPPHYSRVPAGIDDLCAFSARTDQSLLAQAAIAHAQFETIHPFSDGNGRTGRALVHAILKNAGATTRTTVPVSAGLLNDTDSYFAALTAYRNGDPNPIVSRFNAAAFAAVKNGKQLAVDLHEIHARWTNDLGARKDAAAWKVLPHLLSQPAVTSNLVQSKIGVSQPAADNALRQLQDAGIVSRPRTVQRNIVWNADEVTSALDAFADRARRQ